MIPALMGLKINCSFLLDGQALSIVGCCIVLSVNSLPHLLVASFNRISWAVLKSTPLSSILFSALRSCLRSKNYLLIRNKIPTDMNKP